MVVWVWVGLLADVINKTRLKDRQSQPRREDGGLESEIVSQRGKCLIYVCLSSDPRVAYIYIECAHSPGAPENTAVVKCVIDDVAEGHKKEKQNAETNFRLNIVLMPGFC